MVLSAFGMMAADLWKNWSIDDLKIGRESLMKSTSNDKDRRRSQVVVVVGGGRIAKS